MWRSAIRSSSPVETPGFNSDSTSARTSATIRPAWRIFSISRRDFRVTISDALRGGVRRHENLGGDLLDRSPAVDRGEDPGLAVVVDDFLERRELFVHPAADRVLFVVGPLDEL